MTETIHQVSFVGVKESYPIGSPIQCRYVFKEPFVGSSRDWIGLYKVGWRSYDKYETFVWAQLPGKSADSDHEDCEAVVDFPVDNLPKDSKEFYQFCYVSSANQVCGVSTPFQLCSPMDDLIEVQDPDDPNTMVIKTKSQILEEQIDALQKDRLELQKEAQLLQIELDAERVSKGKLMTQIQMVTQLEEELEAEKTDKEHMQHQIQELQNALQIERKSNEQLHEQLRAMRDELLADRRAQEGHRDDLRSENKDKEIQTGASSEAPEEIVVKANESKDIASIPKAEEGIGGPEAVSSSSISAAGEDESKQLSLTERITGSLLKHLKRASDWFAEDFDDDTTAALASGPPEVDDKGEESLKQCPVCNEQFPPDASVSQISEHVERHNGQVCPICFMQFDTDCPDENVTAHVNRHLDNPEEAPLF